MVEDTIFYYFSIFSTNKILIFGFPTILIRKFNIKQNLVELRRRAEYAEFLCVFVSFEF